MSRPLKRPIGAEWDEFVRRWYEANHGEKIQLATEYKVSYDVAKHWISSTGATQKDPNKRMTVTTQELLNSRPSIELDFVSFDIETSNLEADFSVLLTACIKPYGKETMVFRADKYPAWTKERHNDFDIVRDIARELRRHAIVITHYGRDFDVPFMRAKMVKHLLDPLPQMFAIDTYRIAKGNFKISSRRLQNLASFFDIGEKSGVEGRLWMKAAYDGDKKAMDEIVEHNIQDVLILEKLACISFPYLKSIPRL